jgi:hypothetical protein
VPVEVVRREVQQHRHLERQLVHVLELERGQLAHDPGVLVRVHRRQRAADVAGDLDRAPRRAEDLAEQLRRRRLALRARDAEERARCEQPPAELDLAPDGDAELARVRDGRRLRRDSRALDDHAHVPEHSLLGTEAHFDAGRRKPPRIGGRIAVVRDHVDAPLGQRQRRRAAGACEPDDERPLRQRHGRGNSKKYWK